MVGLNPEFAHETMSGLSFSHAVAQTLWHGKLFHIDLNAQRIGKFDQDFRFGSEGIRDAFYVVKLLEDARWDGMRHFDAHPYRTEDADGVWDFARGCMRTYLILADKARRFHEDAEIQEALRVAKAAELAEPTAGAAASPGSWRRTTTRMRWRRRATATSAWTNSSRNCFSGSASAPGASGSTRRPRRARCRCATPTPVPWWHPGAPRTPRRHRRAANSSPADWEAAFDAACAEAGVPTTYRPAASPSPPSSTASSSSTTTDEVLRPAKLWNDTRVGAGHRGRSWPQLARRTGRLGRGLRERAGPQLHHHQAALVAPLRARDASRRTATVLLPHDWLTFRLTGPTHHRQGGRLGDRVLVAARRSTTATTCCRAGRRRRRLGQRHSRGARPRRPSPGSGAATGSAGGPRDRRQHGRRPGPRAPAGRPRPEPRDERDRVHRQRPAAARTPPARWPASPTRRAATCRWSAP